MTTWVQVTGTIQRSGTIDSIPDPAAGSITFTLSHPLSDPVGNVIHDTKPQKARLDETGFFSINLVATNDPGLSPASGAYWQVTENIRGVPVPREWALLVPREAAGAGINLADVSPAVPGPVLYEYATAASVAGFASDLAAEATARSAGDAALDTRVASAETILVTHGSRIATVSGDLITEVGARASADSALSTRITSTQSEVDDAEIRITGTETRIATVSGNLITEATTRADADTALGARIDTVVTNSDTTLLNNRLTTVENDLPTRAKQAALDAEAATRLDADTKLGTRVTSVEGILPKKADLINGVVPTSQIPALALTASIPVASQAAMLALTTSQVQPGDIAIRTDGAGTFILAGENPALLGNWRLLNAPTDVVSSVNGKIGAVVLGAADVGAASTAALTNEATVRADADTALDTRVDSLESGQTTIEVKKADKTQIIGRLFNGTGAPPTNGPVGAQDTDWYLDKAARLLYGPRASGVWPAGMPLDDVTQAELDALATTVSGHDTRLTAVEGHGHTLNALTDVDTAGAVEGDVLKIVAGVWVPAAVSGSATNLDALTDVDLTGATTGQVIKRGSDGVWRPAADDAGTGGGGTVTPTGAIVTRSTDQAIAATTYVRVSFDTIVREDGEFWDATLPDRFVAPVAGWYMISGAARWGTTQSGYVGLFHSTNTAAGPGDGTVIADQQFGSAVLIDFAISGVVYLAAGEHVWMSVWSAGAGTLVAAQSRLAITPTGGPKGDPGPVGTVAFKQEGGYSANGTAPNLGAWGLLSGQTTVRTGQANGVDARGSHLTIRTSTTSGNAAHWSTPLNITSREAKGKLMMRFRLDGDLTSRRDMIGLYGSTSGNTAVNTDPTGPFLLLQFDTGAGHTTWQFATRVDGTAGSVTVRTNTTVVPDTTTVLEFEIDMTGTNVVMTLRSMDGAVLATHTVAAADTPALAPSFGWIQSVATLTTVARGTVGYAGSLTNG